MSKYLYGAAVQGIQGFIMESNVLREIAGGSEFVEEICSTKFETILKDAGYEGNGLIQGAAGIIRYLFEENEKSFLEHVVRNFPFEIQKQAPGITISQAVIKIEGNLSPDHISELIEKLEAQRNNVQLSFLTAPMIAERSRRNGQAAEAKEKKVHLSRQQILKQRLAKSSGNLPAKIGLLKESLPTGDLVELTGKDENKDQWLAVIHADGNSLGKLIMKANTILTKNNADVKEFYSNFSKALDHATIKAAKDATSLVLQKEIDSWKQGRLDENKIPIRPIILGGDDLTIIIKAKYALSFVHKFMELFEENTKELVYNKMLKKFGEFGEFANGLTTCAGIAYIKPNYPFHYALDLAEQLCKVAKKASKEINDDCAPSSLMFHLVHSSFIGDWEEIEKRELKVTGDPATGTIGTFAGGPYFLKEPTTVVTIKKIEQWTKEINKADSLKSQIRALITEYIDNPASANQYEKRLRLINNEERNGILKTIGISGDSIFDKVTNKSHAWDIIKLSTIQKEN